MASRAKTAVHVKTRIPSIVSGLRGVRKVDEGAHGGTIGFKIIIIPGVIVFWPMLLNKWIKKLKHGDTKAQINTEKTP